jgi:hypothetical protein
MTDKNRAGQVVVKGVPVEDVQKLWDEFSELIEVLSIMEWCESGVIEDTPEMADLRGRLKDAGVKIA